MARAVVAPSPPPRLTVPVPELPEVETVRDGLQRWVTGRVVAEVEVRHPRAVRRHLPGAEHLAARLRGARIVAASRRGKFLWLPLAAPDGARDEALVAHLGMSGQLLLQPAEAPDEKHLHVRLRFADGDPELRFVDQRTFGGVLVDTLVPTADRPGDSVPASVAHIARDPLDPAFDEPAFRARLRARRSGVKRALLDQTLISGVGNIYADESLWRARLHGERRSDLLRRPAVTALLGHVREVLARRDPRRRHVVRRPLRQRQRRQRLLRPLPRGLRPAGAPLPPVRHPGATGRLHEPVELLLPPVSAPASRHGGGRPVAVTRCAGNSV